MTAGIRCHTLIVANHNYLRQVIDSIPQVCRVKWGNLERMGNLEHPCKSSVNGKLQVKNFQSAMST